MIQTILLPKEPWYRYLSCKEAVYHYSVHQFGQSLALVAQDYCCHGSMIWILKEGPMNKFFWEKMFSVNLEKTIFEGVICVRNNGELLLSKLNECDFVSCNVETNEVTNFADSWNEWSDSRDWWQLIGSAIDDIEFFDDPVTFTVNPLVGSLVFLDAD